MTAPVAMFSRKMPVVEVAIIRMEVMLIASEMPSRIPIIMIINKLLWILLGIENQRFSNIQFSAIRDSQKIDYNDLGYLF